MGKNTIQEEEFLWLYYKAINISLKKIISSMKLNLKLNYKYIFTLIKIFYTSKCFTSLACVWI